MEDDALGFFKKSSTSHARLNVPALVQVAALAIIMIRCLDLLMIFNTLGFRGTSEFIHRSVQTSNLTLVFLGSLVLLFIEIYCAFSLVKATELGTLDLSVDPDYRQRLSVGCFAGLRIPRTIQYCGESRREILHTLVMQKLPDMLVLLLLFVPASSRRFFRLQ